MNKITGRRLLMAPLVTALFFGCGLSGCSPFQMDRYQRFGDWYSGSPTKELEGDSGQQGEEE